MKKFSYYWGLDFIKNKTVKKVARVVRDVGAVLLSGTPFGAPLLAVLGVAPTPEAGALVAAGAALLEAIRNQAKHE